MEDPWSAFDSHFALAPPLAPRNRPTSLPPRRLAPSFPPLSPPPRSNPSAPTLLSHVHLLDLPEDVFSYVFDYLPTLTLLRLSSHPPSRAFQRLLSAHSTFDLDLDREVSDHPPTSPPPPPTRSLLASRERFAPLIGLARRSSHLSLLTLSSFGPLLTDCVIQPLLDQHCPSLLSLSLANNDLVCPSITASSLCSLDLSRNRRLQSPLLCAPSLLQLDLSRTFINDLDLQKTCEGLTRLRTLRLQSCKNVRRLPLRLPHLTILDLSNTAVVDEALARVAQTSPQLQVLFANECGTLRSPAIASSTLTVLSLRSCESLRLPALPCPALTELDLSDTPVTDAALVALLGGLTQLRVLSLRQCYQLTQPALTHSLPSLTSLDLSMSGVQSEGVQSFMEKAKGLQTLQAEMCTKVVEGLMTRGASDSLPLLCDVSLRSTNIVDDDVAALITAAPLLSRINLGVCVVVSGLGAVASSLTHLDLSFSGVTDRSLATLLSSHVPHLLSASFNHCDGLVHPHVEHLGVQELHFAWCRSMSSLAVDCPALTSIDLSSNHGLASVTLTPTSISSLQLLMARHLNQLTLHTLTEELTARGVQVRSHTASTDSVYQPVAEAGAIRTGRRVAPGTLGRRSVTPSSAAAVSPSAVSTVSATSPTPSPQSAVSVASVSAGGDGEPDHRRRSAPRTIERRREQKEEEEASSSPHPLPPSPSSSSNSPSRMYHSGSPVKSRYLLFSTSTKPRSHRYSSTSLTAPSPSSLSLPPPPLTPPMSTRHRLSRSAMLASSTPSSPASDAGVGDVPPSPHSLTSSFADVSGTILPYPPHALKRSISVAAPPNHPAAPPHQPLSSSQPPPHPYTHPFPLTIPTSPCLSTPGTSLSTLLTSRPIPRSALLSTSLLPPSFTGLPSPPSTQTPTPTPFPPPSSSSLPSSASRFDTRASSLSSVDHLPRYFLNTIELYIIQSHIHEIEGRLRADDAAKGGGGARARPPMTSAPAGALSTAVRYGLKRQLALLKSRWRKEERLVADIAWQSKEGKWDERQSDAPAAAV